MADSKQRLAHWIVDAIALAYQDQSEPCPLWVGANSTWGVGSSDVGRVSCPSQAAVRHFSIYMKIIRFSGFS